MDLICTEQIAEERIMTPTAACACTSASACSPLSEAEMSPTALSMLRPLPIRRIDLRDAVELRVDAEAQTKDRRNPRYIEQVQQHGMTIKWRRRMCQWMFATGKAFELAVDTVGAAIQFMDIYLSLHSVDHVLIQLVAMIALCVASKNLEHRPITRLEMTLLCEHKFTRQQMNDMEVRLLNTLSWNTNPSVSFTFARDLATLAAFEAHEFEVIEEQVMTLLQATSVEYDSIPYKASVLGCAALHAVVKNVLPHGERQVREVAQLLDCDPDEFMACAAFVQGVQDVTFCEPRQLASPTSVESTGAVAEAKSKSTSTSTQVKRGVKAASKSTSTTNTTTPSAKGKRSRDDEVAVPKRRRVARE